MAHLVVEHGKEAKEEVESDQVGRVEPNVPAVGEQEREPGGQWNCVFFVAIFHFFHTHLWVSSR